VQKLPQPGCELSGYVYKRRPAQGSAEIMHSLPQHFLSNSKAHHQRLWDARSCSGARGDPSNTSLL